MEAYREQNSQVGQAFWLCCTAPGNYAQWLPETRAEVLCEDRPLLVQQYSDGHVSRLEKLQAPPTLLC